MNQRLMRGVAAIILALGLALSSRMALAQATPPPPVTNLYSFTGGADGGLPMAGVILDRSGALFGTSGIGGAWGSGTVFRLTPPAPGSQVWTKTELHSFGASGDGRAPTAGLIADHHGALYGTTYNGGSSNGGVAFKLAPPAPGSQVWTETILHSFSGGGDGARPNAGLIADRDGVLYGTTTEGGASNLGTVFRLMPPPSGSHAWTESVLYSFRGGTDGAAPYAELIADQNGVLYGTTSVGGNNRSCSADCGTVFKLTPPAPGSQVWTETVLHRFRGSSDGVEPFSSLIADQAGTLYGTTTYGGTAGYGIVFKLTPPAPGGKAWNETILHTFLGPSSDGKNPTYRLIADRNGVLYGTTNIGGSNGNCDGGCGTLFKLTPPAPGSQVWTETVLYDFTGNGDAIYPVGGLIADANGFLYGASYYGGPPGWGSVFAFRPFFPGTAITSTNSSSEYATLPMNLFAESHHIGQSTWYAYGRVIELATAGNLSYDLLTTTRDAFATHLAPANRWPVRLRGHWVSTGQSEPLPLERRRIGLLAVYDGPPPDGHVGIVEEISLDKKQFRMSEFDRAGTKKFRSNWYYFDGADGEPDARLVSNNNQIKERWYPKFFDASDPTW
jgi:uncharacterized repeat protein (TIGR03803 family)